MLAVDNGALAVGTGGWQQAAVCCMAAGNGVMAEGTGVLAVGTVAGSRQRCVGSRHRRLTAGNIQSAGSKHRRLAACNSVLAVRTGGWQHARVCWQ